MTPEKTSDFYEVHGRPSLHDPVLVVALDGWVDAGIGASTAVASLLADTATEALIGFDQAHYLDQRARRPVAHIVDGITSELSWPQTQIRHGHDHAGADMLYLVGPEPDFHWRRFVDDVVGLAVGYDVRLVVGLGAFPAPAPHTRPVKLAGTAPKPSAALLARVGVVQGDLEVPAGIVAALELAFGDAGIDAVSLWARVPHYVATVPYPDAGAALIDGLAATAGLVLDSSTLHAAADRGRRQIDELIAGNPEHEAMVRALEETIDASEGNGFGVNALPSGDEIAAELEQFLRGEGRERPPGRPS